MYGTAIWRKNAGKILGRVFRTLAGQRGESDSFVPCEMSDIVAENPALVMRYTFPGADHGFSYLVDTPRYKEIVTEFVEKALAPKA